MKKVLLVAAGLMLVAVPAFSQSSDETDDRGSSYSRRDRDLDDLLRGLDERRSGGRPSAWRRFSAALRGCNPGRAVRSARLHEVVRGRGHDTHRAGAHGDAVHRRFWRGGSWNAPAQISC
jgi:hypothetical protein